ncbi:MAG TPA: hypothetical protein VMF62_13525 [Acetobacteraceae bacterium]|nr:hypothetical protein [Acetobacteraceae bacterium]
MPFSVDDASPAPVTPERLAAEVAGHLDILAARSPIAGRLATTLLVREIASRMEPLPAEMMLAALREEARTRPG